MKQIILDMGNSTTTISEVPSPSAKTGPFLISTTASLISADTDRMLVGFGRTSYLEKAMYQPEIVKMMLEKVQTDGLMTTVDAIRSKLSQPVPLGYSNVGMITEIRNHKSSIRFDTKFG